jgi:integrase
LSEVLTSPLYAAHLTHLTALRRQRRQPATLRAYALYVGGFISFLHSRGIAMPTLADLSVELVGLYQDHVLAHSRGSRDGAAAEWQAVRLIKVWSRWLWRRSYVATDPLARIEPPRLAKLHRIPFSEADVKGLLEAARLGPNPVMERALLLLGLDTGCRIGELCATELSDLDLNAGTVLFRVTKNSRTRRVYFGVGSRADGGPCVVALRAWLASRPPSTTLRVFVCNDGAPLSTNRARRIYRDLGVSAGVAPCHPHRGRHTSASEFLASLPGAEMHLRHRLGHVSAEVLADYVSISDTSARQVAEQASLSSKWSL